MKRWHVLVIALIAVSWIGTGAFMQIRENRNNAMSAAMQNNGRQGGGTNGSRDRSQWAVANPKLRKQAIAVITQQISAFKRGDFEAALQLQSAELRKNFPSASAFASMMKGGYPDFLTPKSLDFGRGRVPANDGRISIRVTLTTQDGALIQSVYYLIPEDNTLRVAGVDGGQRDSGRGYGNPPYGSPYGNQPNGGGPSGGGPSGGGGPGGRIPGQRPVAPPPFGQPTPRSI